MERYALAVTAKLSTLSEIKSRFFIDQAGVLAMRIKLTASAGGDVALVRFDGNWKGEVVSLPETRRFKHWAAVDGEVRYVRVAQGRIAEENSAPAGALILNSDGLWLVVSPWDAKGTMLVGVADGERSWPDQRAATIFDQWTLECSVGDTTIFEVGEQGPSTLDVSVHLAR